MSSGRPGRLPHAQAALSCVLVCAALALAWTLPAGAQAPGAAALQQADSLYLQSRFDDAIRTLQDALATGLLTGDDVVRGKELLARSYVKSGRRLEAKEMFKSVLRQDPSYRADPLRVPPDEMEVFSLARREFQAEQVEAGKRLPASIAGHLGYGLYSLSDVNDIVSAGMGDEVKGSLEFGGSVRFPLRPRLSMDLELTRFNGDTEDPQYKHRVSALPLIVSLYYNWMQGAKSRLNVFGGVGPLLVAEYKIEIATLPVALAVNQTGFYGHVGVEGEYLFSPRFALTGRVLGRLAKASDLDYGGAGNFSINGKDPEGRGVDFGGAAFLVGLRGYIGY